ncbi:MAG: peptidoglycan DD-metalloendopeptidase family protein [Chloroflexi bacterium]|nr:peptidoglycan DD-metalloendopeptidase family protein [Chloroflexota bacterium]
MHDHLISRRHFLGLAAGVTAAASPLGLLASRAATLPTYVLPYPGSLTWQCIQGNNSGRSHTGRAAFAWDFRMPQGSPVMAARDGVVAMLKQDSNQSCPQNIYACPDWNNYIVIDHGDGSSAAYLHGYQFGARVKLGQRVKQGDVIGISGTTGQSAGPHLHFQVQHTDPNLYVAQSFPVGFAEVADNGGVPVQRGNYKSANALAADFDILNGHFFTQSNANPQSGGGKGFAVTDAQDAPLWSGLQSGGGVSVAGYPLSRRFTIDAIQRMYQVFQRQVLEWDMAAKQLRSIPISELPPQPLTGDVWAVVQTALPSSIEWSAVSSAWDQFAAAKLASLEAQPRFKAAYQAAGDGIARYGLPQSLANDTPGGISLRMSYASFQISKRDSPFGKAGDLNISQSGDLFLDAEPFSHYSLLPQQLFPEDPLAVVIPAA